MLQAAKRLEQANALAHGHAPGAKPTVESSAVPTKRTYNRSPTEDKPGYMGKMQMVQHKRKKNVKKVKKKSPTAPSNP